MFMIYKAWLLLLLVSGINLNAQDFAPIKNMDDFSHRFKSSNEGVTTVSANFRQSYFSKMLKAPKISLGKFFYSKPNRIRWEDTTSGLILLVDNDQIRLKRNGVEIDDSNERRSAKAIQTMITSILRGDWIESQNDYSLLVFESKTDYKVILTPLRKSISAQVEKIELIIESSNFDLKSLTIIQKTAEKVVYNFDGLRKNEKIPVNYFTQF
jgi:outer membrane lipoprotein-sorting protein